MWALQRRRNRDEKAVQNCKLLFLSALLTEMSCRYIGTCRNTDTTATLSVPGQSASLGFAVWCGPNASKRCFSVFSSQLILPGLRPGNPLAASSDSNLDLIEGQLEFRRGRVW